MLKLSCAGVVLTTLFTGVLLSSGCSRNPGSNSVKTPTPQPSIAASPEPMQSPARQPKPPEPSKEDFYIQALDKADSARNISQSAQSDDDWKLVISQWQEAIRLLRSLPASSPYKPMAKGKLTEFQQGLNEAKKQSTRPNPIAARPTEPFFPPSQPQAQPNNTGRVYQARIKRRAGGTPVIDVTFNGRRSYEMIVDTGASGTVITGAMAAALGVRKVGETTVDTASQRGVRVALAYMDSIAVNGAVVTGVVVAIGNQALDIGLLGQDFFGEYDITVKRDVVEFRAR
jgi:predicted aspartyl protease